MGITIKDIARISGVGISTVSRVINNTGYVSDDVRQRVMKAVKDTHYIPNSSARNLKTNESKDTAILVKSITNPFFHKIIRVIEEKVSHPTCLIQTLILFAPLLFHAGFWIHSQIF